MSDCEACTCIDLFINAGSTTIAVSVDLVSTTGYASVGVGEARYVYDATIDAAYVAAHPNVSFLTANSRGFLLSEGKPTPLMTGALADGTSDDTVALQALFDYSLTPFIQKAGAGYRTTVPISLRQGHHVTGNGGLLYRDDPNDHILRLDNLTDAFISEVAFSHNFFSVGVEPRGSSSAIHMIGCSGVTVTCCDFNHIGLFCISSDQGGGQHIVYGNRATYVGGTFADFRTETSGVHGEGPIIIANTISWTGDDAIDCAGYMDEVVIANNTILHPGQWVTYGTTDPSSQKGGGGIRVNGSATVIGNRILDANLFFVTCAVYSQTGFGDARPTKTLVSNNVGRGIKPTVGTTTGCVIVKTAIDVQISDNIFDPRYGNDLTVTSIVDNGSGKTRITTATPHNLYVGNAVRFESATSPYPGGTGSVLTVISSTVVDINLTYSASFSSSGVLWPAVDGVRLYGGVGKARIATNEFYNVENGLRVTDTGVAQVNFEDNDVESYTRPTQFSNNPTITEFRFNRNKLRNCRSITGGALFYSATSTSITITSLVIDDNELFLGTYGLPNEPLFFSGIVVTTGETLRNKMLGAATQYLSIASITSWTFDGDMSELRYAAGTATIPAGSNTTGAISHGLSRQPSKAEFEMKKIYLTTNTTGGELNLEGPSATTFTIRTEANVTADISVYWSITPKARRFINGTTTF